MSWGRLFHILIVSMFRWLMAPDKLRTVVQICGKSAAGPLLHNLQFYLPLPLPMTRTRRLIKRPMAQHGGSCMEHDGYGDNPKTINRSCVYIYNLLLESLNDWTISLSNKQTVVVGYIDFQRAFDVISHNKLLHKLSSYGISGNLLRWISSFLTNRFHSVRINSHLSSYLPVLSGVPQGSVLGPILFNLFIMIYQTISLLTSLFKLFADDLKLYTQISSIHSTLNFQKHLDIISDWSKTWQINISYHNATFLNSALINTTLRTT